MHRPHRIYSKLFHADVIPHLYIHLSLPLLPVSPPACYSGAQRGLYIIFPPSFQNSFPLIYLARIHTGLQTRPSSTPALCDEAIAVCKEFCFVLFCFHSLQLFLFLLVFSVYLGKIGVHMCDNGTQSLSMSGEQGRGRREALFHGSAGFPQPHKEQS